ncbi:hypothetical protein V5799_020536 [Amblyomma americanum]|uniref:RING-CH-type domain-containing protein n=1 Tax=Amblyomma americanum TaxID=6943 RepID=A0AAQ4EUG1_AMBAM
MADTETAAARGDNAAAGEAVHDSTLELQPHLALDSCIPASDSAVPVCRICYGEADEENGILLMPCNCRGSIAFAHRLCLEVCLREWDTDRCKVCRARIKVRRKRAVRTS